MKYSIGWRCAIRAWTMTSSQHCVPVQGVAREPPIHGACGRQESMGIAGRRRKGGVKGRFLYALFMPARLESSRGFMGIGPIFESGLDPFGNDAMLDLAFIV